MLLQFKQGAARQLGFGSHRVLRFAEVSQAGFVAGIFGLLSDEVLAIGGNHCHEAHDKECADGIRRANPVEDRGRNDACNAGNSGHHQLVQAGHPLPFAQLIPTLWQCPGQRVYKVLTSGKSGD